MNSTPEGLPVRLSTTAIPVGSAAAGDATATAPARARVTSPTRPIFPAEKRANAMVVVAMTGLPIVYRLAAGLPRLPFRAPSWAPSYNRFDEPWRGHIGTLAPHGLIELMRLVWGVRLV